MENSRVLIVILKNIYMKIVLEAKKIKIINENIHNYLQYILSEDVLEKKMAWERNIFCFEQDIKKIILFFIDNWKD